MHLVNAAPSRLTGTSAVDLRGNLRFSDYRTAAPGGHRSTYRHLDMILQFQSKSAHALKTICCDASSACSLYPKPTVTNNTVRIALATPSLSFKRKQNNAT
jgi:hypothetical protein